MMMMLPLHAAPVTDDDAIVVDNACDVVVVAASDVVGVGDGDDVTSDVVVAITTVVATAY